MTKPIDLLVQLAMREWDTLSISERINLLKACQDILPAEKAELASRTLMHLRAAEEAQLTFLKELQF